jgi:hypothetical protein
VIVGKGRGHRTIDLSHEIGDGMTTQPGIPRPAITTFLSIRGMATFPVRAFALLD